jgi:hypothetical protein
MAVTLHDILTAPETMPNVVKDGIALVDGQISDKSGISGAAIKLAYKAVTTFSPDHIQYMVYTLLPQMAEKLQPYWDDFQVAGGGVFGDYLAKRGEEAAEALLTITDARAEASNRPVIVKAYKSVRSGAAKNVQAALPDLGALVQKYAG